MPGTVAMTMPQILQRQLLALEVGISEAVDLHTEAGRGERSVVSGNIPAGAEFSLPSVPRFKPLSLPLPLPLASTPQLLPSWPGSSPCEGDSGPDGQMQVRETDDLRKF